MFYDTAHYLDLGKSIVIRLPLLSSLAAASPEAETAHKERPPAAATNVTDDREHPSLSYAGGRSAQYSAVVYLLSRVGGLWSIAIAQALVAVFLLWTTAQAMSGKRKARTFLVLTAGLAMVSALPFYVDMAMPDVFCGLGLLALGLLICASTRFSWPVKTGLAIVAAWSAVSHTSTFAVMAVTVIVAAAIALALKRANRSLSLRKPLAWVAASLLVAVAVVFATSFGFKLVLGAAPKSPPFLMSRVLADGPGRAYLAESCAHEARYALCEFKDREFQSTDDFLWSGDPRIGVFSVAPYETRKKLQAEELSFVANAVARHPLWQLRKSLEHFGQQLVTFGVRGDFAMAAPSWDEMSFARLLPEQTVAYTNALAYRGLFPFEIFDVVQITAVVVSLSYLVLRFSRADVRTAMVRRAWREPECVLLLAFVLLVTAILANAAICGMFSGVYDRYQARMIWLVPALAFITFSELGAGPRRKRA